MAYARRRDKNQSDLEAELRRLGFHTIDTSRQGHGFPDMLVLGYNRHTDTTAALMVEVKTRTGKLTVDEQIFMRELPDGAPYIVARSTEDVLAWFGAN